MGSEEKDKFLNQADLHEHEPNPRAVKQASQEKREFPAAFSSPFFNKSRKEQEKMLRRRARMKTTGPEILLQGGSATSLRQVVGLLPVFPAEKKWKKGRSSVAGLKSKGTWNSNSPPFPADSARLRNRWGGGTDYTGLPPP